MMKKLVIICLMSLLSLLSFALAPKAYADIGIPYQTFTYSSSTRSFIRTQDAYLPLSMQSAFGSITLSAPKDITVDANDNIYVADAGKIIKYSLATDEVTLIGEGLLSQPNGVHVDALGRVYVADLGTKKAYQFEYNDTTLTYDLKVTYEKPVGTPYFDETDPFEPSKIVT